MGKPTMQDIANRLSTSRISVWKALNNRPGISDSLRQQVYQTAEKMGYFKQAGPAQSSNIIPSLKPRTVSAIVARPESSLFWMQIIHQIAKQLGKSDVSLMYTYLPTFYKQGYALPPTLYDNTLAGAIILNTYSAPILHMLAQLPMPKVFLDTVPGVPFNQLNGDLVLIEGRTHIAEITGRLLDKGCAKIGFIGDIDYAQTNTDRYNGFLDAHRARKIKPNPAFCMVSPLNLRTHYQEISNFLNKLSCLPDAFVCPSDYIAHFIKKYFTENQTPGGEKLVLTGFDNNTEYANIANKITTVDVQTKSLGSRLANKILFAINNPSASHEVSYVNSSIIYKHPIL